MQVGIELNLNKKNKAVYFVKHTKGKRSGKNKFGQICIGYKFIYFKQEYGGAFSFKLPSFDEVEQAEIIKSAREQIEQKMVLQKEAIRKSRKDKEKYDKEYLEMLRERAKKLKPNDREILLNEEGRKETKKDKAAKR